MSDDPLSAEEVAHRRFSYAFRGFDTGEVRDYLDRVAAELRTSVKRERELQRKLTDAEYRAAHPVIDQEVLTSALGEETSRILASAHDVARELKAKAEENAARILREAHGEAQRIRASAEIVLAERTEEADAAAEEIRRAARSEVESSVVGAREEAAAIVAEAEAKAERMLHEAEAASARVVNELGRRRRVAQAQVEQLRAGRERLLEAYRVVRRTLEEVGAELQRAEPEARMAAEAVARRTGIDLSQAHDDDDVIDVDELAAASGHEDTEIAVVGRDDPVSSLPPHLEGEGASDPEPETGNRPGAGARAEAHAHADADAGDSVAPPPEPAEAPAGPQASDFTRPSGAEQPVAATDRPVPRAGRDHAGLSSMQLLGSQEEGGRPSSDAGQASADEPAGPSRPSEPAGTVTAADRLDEVRQGRAAAAPAPAGQEQVASAVTELFARIKAGRSAAVAEAEEVLAGGRTGPTPTVGSTPRNKGDASPAADEPLVDDDEAALQRRDALLEAITPRLSRKVKRALQDEQNEILDGLRSRGSRSALDLLPRSEDQATRYRRAGAGLLEEAALAGARFISADASVRPEVGDLCDDLAEALAAPLRRRLQRGMAAQDGEDLATTAERVSAAYREWKTQRIDGLAGDAIVSAFSRGTTEATTGALLRWIVDDDGGPCPDCHDNALAGPTPSGEPYPTGQPHPPAHAGCRCLLVPAST